MNVTPVIETVIKSLFDSFNGTENKTLPIASQLLIALPQLHSVLQNSNEKANKPAGTVDQSRLTQFDTLIETSLVQQLLKTMNADPNQI